MKKIAADRNYKELKKTANRSASATSGEISDVWEAVNQLIEDMRYLKKEVAANEARTSQIARMLHERLPHERVRPREDTNGEGA